MIDETRIELTSWIGPWSDDDPDANLKADVALYARSDPLRTLRGLSASTGVPVGALVRYVLAKWASEGASGLLELGPTMTRRLHGVCQQAESDGSDEARLAAFHQLTQMIGWLNFPLEHPEIYDDPIDRVQRARALSGTQLRDYYDRWAVNYDRDVFDELGFTGPDLVAAALHELVEPGGVVLDVGCGTGVTGERLAAHGFDAIDGLDFSPGMLKVARNKKVADRSVYRDLIEADLTASIPIADATYQAVVSTGTFVGGHVNSGALFELVRVVKPGGVLVFTVADAQWATGDFDAVLSGLVESALAKSVDARPVDVAPGGIGSARLVIVRMPGAGVDASLRSKRPPIPFA